MPNPTYRAWPALARFPRPALLTAVGATLLVALTACGGGSDKAGDTGVASIASPDVGGGSSKASADPDAGRPQIRLDSTEDDINRMMNTWLACVKQKGGSGGLLDTKVHPNGAVAKACLSKHPLDPPELDPAKNPKFSDGLRVMVKCMNGHGFKSVVSDGGSSWGLVHGGDLGARNYDSVEVACQVKAWGGDN
ncbi:hypothetical protein [Streptomyces prunicolor]|uniref:Lipoprotein n=1 Tax=Streptomyces prunicolor TaxID=67348 RepID=A0ABU4F876_9ACTN|nr:hypothetical protein [Streptomyces prunicolor]MDV7216797.1 hypothetical protein [Streptomyces prunicolor]